MCIDSKSRQLELKTEKYDALMGNVPENLVIQKKSVFDEIKSSRIYSLISEKMFHSITI